MISNLLIYKSGSLDPYINLATEKLLFDTLPEHSLILYLWQNENTVVIGKNQNPWEECSCPLMAEDGVRLARRLSGGGAVYHDTGNLNFTFICQSEDYDLSKQLGVIISACGKAGIKAELSGRNDILADGRKFSGNAFYNSGGRSYHHGTLLISSDTDKVRKYLTPDSEKLRSKGVRSVSSRIINLSELSPGLTTALMADYMLSAAGDVYALSPSPCPGPSAEETERLVKEYSAWEFLYGGTLPFSYEAKARFSWGGAELKLNTEKGTVRSAVLYTDSMDHLLSDKVSTVLSGIRLKETDIKEALSRHLNEDIAQDILSLIKKIL